MTAGELFSRCVDGNEDHEGGGKSAAKSTGGMVVGGGGGSLTTALPTWGDGGWEEGGEERSWRLAVLRWGGRDKEGEVGAEGGGGALEAGLCGNT